MPYTRLLCRYTLSTMRRAPGVHSSVYFHKKTRSPMFIFFIRHRRTRASTRRKTNYPFRPPPPIHALQPGILLHRRLLLYYNVPSQFDPFLYIIIRTGYRCCIYRYIAFYSIRDLHV